MRAMISFIFIGALVVMGIMLSKAIPESATTTETKISSSPESSVAQGGGAPTGSLVVWRVNNNINTIESINIESGKSKTLFTDQDKPQAIQSISFLAGETNSLIASVGEDGASASRLVALSTDGSNKVTLLTDNFLANSAPTISADGRQLAYTRFNNNKFDLITNDATAQKPVTVFTGDSPLTAPQFSVDAQKVAYLIDNGDDSFGADQVQTIEIATKKVETLYTVPKKDILLYYHLNNLGLLTVIVEPYDPTITKGSAAPVIYLVDPRTGSNMKVEGRSTYKRSPILAPDGTGIAYLDSNFERRDGEVVLVTPNNTFSKKFGTARSILGWTR